MSALTFEVPLPPRALSPNSGKGSSRIAKSKWVKRYREDCALHARIAAGADWEPLQRAEVRLTFCLKDRPAPFGQLDRASFYHPKDQDNAIASVKALIDSLREQLIAGDEWGRLSVSAALDKSRGPYVIVTVAGWT